MENAPVVSITAMSIGPEDGERWDKWWDTEYGQLYIQKTETKEIDRYRIVKRNPEFPGMISVYHHENLGKLKEAVVNPDRLALINDLQTWPIDWYWINPYRLLRSFRGPEVSRFNIQDTIVDGIPVMLMEGYKLPPETNEKYSDWLARWGSRLYIPMLLKGTSVKCINFFQSVEYKVPLWENVQMLEPDVPQFMSMAFFESVKDADEYKASVEYAIFKRSLELELSGQLKLVWGTEYQLVKSWRK